METLIQNERVVEFYSLKENFNKESKDRYSDIIQKIYTEISDQNKETIKVLEDKLIKLENTNYELTNSTILKLDEIKSEHWIINQKKHSLTINDNSISVIQEKNKEVFLVYLDKKENLNISTKHFSEEFGEANDYKIIFEGESIGTLCVTLGVVKYYLGGTVETEFINLNEELLIEQDNLVTLSFILKFVNSGEFKINRIEVQKNEKVYITDISEKYLKAQNFLKVLSEKWTKTNNDKITYNITIAGILDEFSRECFNPEVDLENLSYDNWRIEIKNKKPELLFVESVWRGINNSWRNEIARNDDEISIEIQELLKYCNSNKIPTVFWNKEGAINFEYFKHTSALFDYVFVTDENIIKKQKEVCKHNNVYILPFAAQPKLHNPINKNKNKLGQVAFAGTWYGYKHPTRIKDMNIILEPALNYDVDIYDRIFDFSVENVDESLKWPEKYSNNIVGQLPYRAIIEAYKNYDVFLNVNSIKNSKYMMARRVYEILACKTPVISSYSEAIEYQLKDYVNSCKTKEEAERILKQLLTSKHLLDKQGKLGQRFVLENHTYSKRVETIFDVVGLRYEKKVKSKVTIIGTINSLEGFDVFFDNIIRQTYKNLEGLIVINNEEINIDYINEKTAQLSNLRVISRVGLSRDETLSILMNECSGDYLAFFSEDAYYGDNYIRDYVNALLYIDAEVVGKANYYKYVKDKMMIIKITNGLGEDCYCNNIYARTLFLSKKIFKALNYHHNQGEKLENVILDAIKSENLNIYSDDCNSFCDKDISDNLDSLNYEIIFFTSDYKTFINV